MLVTSPNTHVIFTPPLNTCKVRFRKALNFGEDDPIYYPQPFESRIGHLALIPRPSYSRTNRLFLAWFRPNERVDLTPVSSSDVFVGLVLLDKQLFDTFNDVCNGALANIPQSQKDDPYLAGCSTQLKRYLERLLKVPGPKEKCLLLFACAQRLLLETVARTNWLGIYASRIAAAPKRGPPPPVLEVVGAFTEDLDTLDRLFYAGIPVWYVRPASETPNVRIDKVGWVIATNEHQKLSLQSLEVDVSDTVPPHRIVYTGLANKADRYSSMVLYVRSLLQPPSHLGKYVPNGSGLMSSTSHSSAASRTVAHGNQRSAPCTFFSPFFGFSFSFKMSRY